MPGLLSGSVEIAGYTFLVQDGELMVFEPGHEGDSEPISWGTCERLMNVLYLAIQTARRAR